MTDMVLAGSILEITLRAASVCEQLNLAMKTKKLLLDKGADPTL
jgi:hypothetical protein